MQKKLLTFHTIPGKINLLASSSDLLNYKFFRTEELCLAFSNNQWHRGVLMESKGDGTPVVLLHDLNCFVEVPVEKIRKMPPQLKNPQPMTHLCRIAGKF